MSYLRGAGAVGVGAWDIAAATAGGELCSTEGGGGGSAHPRPQTVPSMGPGHAWIKEKMERVEDFCYT